MRDLVALVELNGVSCRSIARKLRAEHMYCKILPAGATAADILAQEPLGVILVGGDSGMPYLFHEESGWLETGLPTLAMGDAALGMCMALGGSLSECSAESEVAEITLSDDQPELFHEVEMGERYLTHPRWMELHDGMEAVVTSPKGVLGFSCTSRQLYGMAFQAEQNDPDGVQLLVNFCRRICGCTPWWSNQAFVDRAVRRFAAVWAMARPCAPCPAAWIAACARCWATWRSAPGCTASLWIRAFCARMKAARS